MNTEINTGEKNIVLYDEKMYFSYCYELDIIGYSIIKEFRYRYFIEKPEDKDEAIKWKYSVNDILILKGRFEAMLSNIDKASNSTEHIFDRSKIAIFEENVRHNIKIFNTVLKDYPEYLL